MQELTNAEIAALTIERWKTDIWGFIHEACLTIDEADSGKVKAFPDLDYLRIICEVWEREKLLAIPKSRRMMLTWITLALHLHLAMFTPNSAIFIQSKKYLDSDYLLGDNRFLFMYRNLPQWFFQFGGPKLTQRTQGLLRFSNGTMIKGIGQGPDQLRQYTATAIMIDEIAFMEQAESTWTAVRPVLQGGGRATLISSVAPGFFQRIVYGQLQDRNRKDGVILDDESSTGN
jgi:phage FluMu gp28-like protein